MKTRTFLLVWLIVWHLLSVAQSPNGMNYQAIVRDGNGEILSSSNVALQLTVLSGSSGGNVVYSEIHNVQTNSFGLINLIIGQGNQVTGQFNLIDWSEQQHFLKVELDISGSGQFSLLGVNELLSVPYAKYADKAGNVNFSDTSATNELNTAFSIQGNQISITDAGGTQSAQISASAPASDGEVLTWNNTTAQWQAQVPAGDDWGTQSAVTDGITLSGNGTATSPLTGNYQSGSGINVDNTTGIITNLGDGDNDPANEIQTLSKTGQTVELSKGGGSFTDETQDADADPNNELINNLDILGNEITITESGGVHSAMIAGVAPTASGQVLTWNQNTVQWEAQSPANNNGWSLLGNSGTIDRTHFIGTTDSVPLNIHVNNKQAGRISPAGEVFIGMEAGLTDTTKQSTAIGYQSLKSNVSGTRNTALGYEAMKDNTIGYSNTANGFGALQMNVDGSFNAALGTCALSKNISGDFNTAIGYNALKENDYGNHVTAVGCEVLEQNTYGTANSGLGYQTLKYNTNGNNNSAFGVQSMLNNTNGSYNAAFGVWSLYSNTEGEGNTAIGYGAGYNNTIGINNVSIGYGAAYGNTSGNHNVAVGNNTLKYNTTGSKNTAVGTNALLDNTLGSENTSLGYGSLSSNTTGSYSTASGFQALEANESGDANSGFGYQSLKSNTSGHDNSAFGAQSLYSNTTGSLNAACGEWALFNNSSGEGNTAVGFSAGYKNTSGDYNVALGCNAAFSNSTGKKNIAIGKSSLSYNSTGNNNIAIGELAMSGNTTGNFNIAIGQEALSFSETINNLIAIGDSALYKNGYGASGSQAVDNTAIGSKSMVNNTTGSDNTALGPNTLYSNTTGFGNTAVGSYSLNANETGQGNTGIGNSTLAFNTSGYNNTATGYNSLLLNTTGYNNTAYGMDAMYHNKTGNLNTAVGISALSKNYSGAENCAFGNDAAWKNDFGSYNVAVGTRALYQNTNGNANTAVGPNAMYFANTGGSNTALGNWAGPADGTWNINNSTAIGNGASITASNQIRVGNGSVTSIGGYANWTNLSDGRFKNNVKNNVPGLDFIMKLNPVTYTLDVNSLIQFMQLPDSIAHARGQLGENALIKSQIVQTGFIAQEVEYTAKNLGFDFSGIDTPKNERDHYGLRYAEFTVPLVKAMQEQQQIINDQQIQIDDLKSRIEALERIVIHKN